MKHTLVMEISEKPKNKLQWGLLSMQHLFAMFGATVLVPILTGLSISVALFSSGVGTLIYIFFTKAKVPVYLGSSFAYIAAISIASQSYGAGAAFIGLAVVGIIYVIVALLIKYLGVNWLNKILPAVVIGPMIAIIGISLAAVATGQAGLSPNSADGFFAFLATDIRNPLIALVSFATTVVLAIFAKGFLKVVPIIGGILVGYVFAIVVGVVDFTPLTTIEWIKIPEFTILGTYAIDFRAVLMFAPISFVTIAEHIGDHKVLGSITNKDFLKDPGLDKTLLGDGVATLFAAVIGGPANTTYGENTGVVGMTKVGSVYVTGLAAIFAIILSFFNIVTGIIQTIPAPVMGGVLILLFGLIAGNGLKVMIDAKVNLSSMRNLIIVATMFVLGLGQASISINDASALTGMSLAAIVGIVLNLLLPEEKTVSSKENTVKKTK
jgi:uracil permease